jgi:hypothetical protein
MSEQQQFVDYLTRRFFSRSSATIILVLTWAICYLPNLRTSPGWYGDETITILAGKSILRGDFANRALKYSFFSPFTNYQPPAITAYALFAGITNGDILGARILSVVLALVIAIVVHRLLAERLGEVAAFIAAITILLTPQHTIHFRWVYPHYFCSLAVVLIGLLQSRPPSPRRDWLMGFSCGVAACGHLLAMYVTLAAIASCIKRPAAWMRIIAPPAVVVLVSLSLGYYASGAQLFKDLSELAGTYASSSRSTDTLGKCWNVFRFFSWDAFHILMFASLVGLVLTRRFAEAAFAGIISIAIIQNRAELPVFYYQSMVFVPLLAVYAIEFGYRIAYALARRLSLHEQAGRVGACATISLLPLCFAPQAIGNSIAGTHVSRNSFWVAPSASDLEKAAAWINANSVDDELIVSYWDAGWLLRGRWTDLMQCAVWSYGNFPFFYDRDRTHAEFLFPADLRTAKFVLVGQLDVRWLWGQGQIPQMLEKYDLPKWPIVYRTETTAVLRNPAFKPSKNDRNDGK